MKTKKQKRVSAIIDSVREPHSNERGSLTVWTYLKMGAWYQGFGGLALDEELANSYVHDLCAAFAVRNLGDLVGKKCFALYAFSGLNEPIEGLESASGGRRFIHNAWRRKHFPDTRSLLDRRLVSVESALNMAKNRLENLRLEYAELPEDFIDWERA